MTWISYRGVELSARFQQVLLGIEVGVLVAFAAVALVKVYTGGTSGSLHPSLSWINPFALSPSALVDGEPARQTPVSNISSFAGSVFICFRFSLRSNLKRKLNRQK